MTYEELLQVECLDNYSQKDKVSVIGKLFDYSFDNSNIEGLNKGFELLKQIKFKELKEVNKTVLFYDISNGWSYLRKLKYHNTSQDWSFQMQELTQEIYFLRKAISSQGFKDVEKERQCQIYTNLGNSFSFIGRFVEAQDYWNKAIQIIPNFAMALGNKGNGLFYYGQVLFDKLHKVIFLNHSYYCLKEALELKQYLEGNAEAGIKQLKEELESMLNSEALVELIDLNNFDLGNEEKLAKYRKWCINQKLYINPLNDLGVYTNASHDCLNLSTVVVKVKTPPTYFTLYNQIKQEYATARFSFYNSTESRNEHFSDEDVVLLDTIETALYSYNLEQVKIAFRLSYSIFDKIAYLLNDYLNLEITLHKVSFRGLWHKGNDQELNSIFSNSNNWALRGLYWLSKDLYETAFEFDKVLEPEAKELAKIRNHIEHKCLKVIDDIELYNLLFDTENDISYVISRQTLEEKTLKILKLSRASIIYLSLAIDHEEKYNKKHEIETVPIQLKTIPKFRKT